MGPATLMLDQHPTSEPPRKEIDCSTCTSRYFIVKVLKCTPKACLDSVPQRIFTWLDVSIPLHEFVAPTQLLMDSITGMLHSIQVKALISALLILALQAAARAEYVASPEPDWPQFRGPERSGISPETNLLQVWPENGPPRLWCATNLGTGYASPIVAGGRIFITGDAGDDLHLFALDLSGKLLWKATNGAAWKSPYPGARASCAFSSDRVYHMNAHGQAACFDAATGSLLWTSDVVSQFDSRKPTWGISECLLVDENRVIVTPGGHKASMAALDAHTGRPLWTTEPLEAASGKPEGPAYAPPILIRVFGRKHIVGVTARHFFGVNAETGKLEWKLNFPTRHEVIGSSPVLCGDGIFVTGPDNEDGRFLRFVRCDDGISVQQAWTATLDTCHGGIVSLDGFLYGSWYRSFNGWGCLDARDGSIRWRDRQLAMGSAIYADGHLYCLTQKGIMALIKPNPEKLEILSQFVFATVHQNNVWTHPVITGGKLYLRDQQALYCFDIRRKSP